MEPMVDSYGQTGERLRSTGTVVGTYSVTGYGIAFDGTNIWLGNFKGGLTRIPGN